MDSNINEGDNVVIVFPETLRDYEKYFSLNQEQGEFSYYLNGKELDKNYIIKEGDRIYRLLKKREEKKENEGNIEKGSIEDRVHKITDENEGIFKEIDKVEGNSKKEIVVTVNGKNIVLKGKKEYIFVDIFNYVEFDLSSSKGKLYLHLNGNNVGYYDKLSQGDIIEIGWE